MLPWRNAAIALTAGRCLTCKSCTWCASICASVQLQWLPFFLHMCACASAPLSPSSPGGPSCHLCCLCCCTLPFGCCTLHVLHEPLFAPPWQVGVVPGASHAVLLGSRMACPSSSIHARIHATPSGAPCSVPVSRCPATQARTFSLCPPCMKACSRPTCTPAVLRSSPPAQTEHPPRACPLGMLHNSCADKAPCARPPCRLAPTPAQTRHLATLRMPTLQACPSLSPNPSKMKATCARPPCRPAPLVSAPHAARQRLSGRRPLCRAAVHEAPVPVLRPPVLCPHPGPLVHRQPLARMRALPAHGRHCGSCNWHGRWPLPVDGPSRTGGVGSLGKAPWHAPPLSVFDLCLSIVQHTVCLSRLRHVMCECT